MIFIYLFIRLVEGKNSSQWIILDIIRIITTQSVHKLTQLTVIYNENVKNSTLVIMVAIWLISASVITKCFSSMLLNMYFLQKSEPLVEKLEQLCSKTGIDLAIVDPWFSRKEYFPLHFDCLLSKEAENIKRVPGYADWQLGPLAFIDMVNGYSVMVTDTMTFNRFEAIFSIQKEKYSVSEHEYGYWVLYHIIDKKSLIRNQMRFG